MTLKKCISCQRKKPLSEFYRIKKISEKRRGMCIVCYKEYAAKLQLKPKVRYNTYKRDSKRRGIKFSLSKKQFYSFENKPCRYCGEKVVPISLDRIDNDLGYIDGNVDACCHTCNSLKHIFEEKIFLEHVKKIYKYCYGDNDE